MLSYSPQGPPSTCHFLSTLRALAFYHLLCLHISASGHWNICLITVRFKNDKQSKEVRGKVTTSCGNCYLGFQNAPRQMERISNYLRNSSKH